MNTLSLNNLTLISSKLTQDAPLESILKEVQLKRIRQINLCPCFLVPPKIVHHYRRRASTEPPRELRRHPAAIRYTLIAAFCWQRSQEITDSLVELLVQIIHLGTLLSAG